MRLDERRDPVRMAAGERVVATRDDMQLAVPAKRGHMPTDCNGADGVVLSPQQQRLCLQTFQVCFEAPVAAGECVLQLRRHLMLGRAPVTRAQTDDVNSAATGRQKFVLPDAPGRKSSWDGMWACISERSHPS